MDHAPRHGGSPSSAAAPPPSPRYSLPPIRLPLEDILFCVDVDAEALSEMKAAPAPAASPGPPGATGAAAPAAAALTMGPRPAVKRMDAVKQALMLFVHSKLTMCPDHRFAFATLRDTVSLVKKEFSSDSAPAIEIIQSLAATETRYAMADLTQLFKIAYEEGKRAELQGRLLRVVLIYCRSSTKPHHQWPIKQKNFTMDIVYLHDKPTADNCPQRVYDVLVDALEHVSQYEGYILETGQGLARVLFRQTCILLSHPLQRCMQDDLDIPKQVVKKTLVAEAVQNEDSVPVSSQ
ncbi:uncharacterized protein LOC100846437 [Brachypodium distachyon]|uniref:BRISC and BRCA1-A complex member 1 n=1 Tax=Brachypodium distachyon TaxID=15368 RepID=I1H1J3_BRADI|nr:uncharacterized protein LOC100846437 [Brachypodium distachyon]KQK19840.1 hypothetical protein BRADI_1g50790v3 [Brachypodium distachyon]KQK19841.1 hypothetical protein BRADI_1g50790v3 [Brachypodium distachyon]PNT76629.1 hypothetical protein BRADI_1g50790v3 [Brachypodium distachyon]|eukprot:XP_003557184.1 uncharacterized protein LOC100846437 [Brachypodium distachyon]